MTEPSREIGRALAEMLRRPESEAPLDELTLQVARLEYPQLDASAYCHRLDELAAAVTFTGDDVAAPSPLGLVGALNRCLFEREAFHGNTGDYYDPRNSFLNEVLDRRTGIPILLSVLYIEVARRVGAGLRGVGLPGHFLVLVPGPPQVYVDPFHGGRMLATSDCEDLLREIYGADARLEPGWLDPVTNKYIITRILNNLRNVYQYHRQLRKLLGVLDVLIEVYPLSAEDYKQRALVHQELKQYARAIADFERYRQVAPEAKDAAAVDEALAALRRTLARMN